MDMNTAALTGLKLAGYDRPLSFWEEGFQSVSTDGNGHKRPIPSSDMSGL